MGKTYINTIKYLIKGKIEIDGVVEKPDVVGAIFGQTEGLLGEDMDLRELQKSGKIGRIEVNIKTKSGKSEGNLTLSSSMDQFDTSTIAAALETVDRVGPCEAKVEVQEIQDTRADKREFVMKRAQEILSKFRTTQMPESKEISSQLRSSVKKAKIQSYGKDKLPAGPDIDSSPEVIVVEGRADVLALLDAGINNVISLKGSVIPDTVVQLSKKKEITLFVDGDRGGEIIVKEFSQLGSVNYVAKAPDGKEVEELTQKEILKQLKNKVPLKEFKYNGKTERTREQTPKTSSSSRSSESDSSRSSERSSRRSSRQRHKSRRPPRRKEEPTPKTPPSDLSKTYDEIKGSMKAVLVSGDKKKEVGVPEMVDEIKKTKDVESVVFDGIITQRLVELADSKGIKNLVGLKKAKIEKPGKVQLFTMA
jgi:DNA primase